MKDTGTKRRATKLGVRSEQLLRTEERHERGDELLTKLDEGLLDPATFEGSSRVRGSHSIWRRPGVLALSHSDLMLGVRRRHGNPHFYTAWRRTLGLSVHTRPTGVVFYGVTYGKKVSNVGRTNGAAVLTHLLLTPTHVRRHFLQHYVDTTGQRLLVDTHPLAEEMLPNLYHLFSKDEVLTAADMESAPEDRKLHDDALQEASSMPLRNFLSHLQREPDVASLARRLYGDHASHDEFLEAFGEAPIHLHEVFPLLAPAVRTEALTQQLQLQTQAFQEARSPWAGGYLNATHCHIAIDQVEMLKKAARETPETVSAAVSMPQAMTSDNLFTVIWGARPLRAA